MRERETEKHAHATRLTTIAESVVTTFGLNFFRVASFATRDKELGDKKEKSSSKYHTN